MQEVLKSEEGSSEKTLHGIRDLAHKLFLNVCVLIHQYWNIWNVYSSVLDLSVDLRPVLDLTVVLNLTCYFIFFNMGFHIGLQNIIAECVEISTVIAFCLFLCHLFA